MSLSERARNILKRLLTDDKRLSYDKLANEFQVSERAIRYDLDEIDSFLLHSKLPPLKRQTKVEVMLDSHHTHMDKLKELTSSFETSLDYFLPEKRHPIILIDILLSPEKVDINGLMDKCEVSRSTIVGDIRELRKNLQNESISIAYSSSSGYFFEGSEKQLRKFGLKLITTQTENLNLPHQRLIETYLPEHRETILSLFEQFISLVETDMTKSYTDVSFNHMVVGLIIAVNRLKSGCTLEEEMNESFLSPEYYSIQNHAAILEDECGVRLNHSELRAIEQLFLESSLLKADSVIDDNWINLNLFIIEFLEELSAVMSLPLNQSNELYEALILHLGPAINRVKNESPLKNEIIDYIQTEYEDIYLTVKAVLDRLGESQNLLFTPDEIGFVTIHIASYIEKAALINNDKTILLVCNYGVGTAKLLETMMLKHFKFTIKGTISMRELNQQRIDEEGVDYIVSTLPIKQDLSVPHLVVSPLLSETDRKNLQAIEASNNGPQFKQYSRERRVTPIMLKDLLVEETIELNVEADNWQDSVNKGGKLLEEAGKIDETYTKAMITSVEELGPYIVIAPGIAMPHASSKDGVHEVGLSLMTLTEPVNFGHPENDPVDIVLCLATTDHTSHLNALKDLMAFLNDPSFIELLKNGTKEEILNKIKGEESA
jgi:transcriptional antiterminator/mannitol/fructose-specific phosphotransferase system IIA component (Ntr-type)